MACLLRRLPFAYIANAESREINPAYANFFAEEHKNSLRMSRGFATIINYFSTDIFPSVRGGERIFVRIGVEQKLLACGHASLQNFESIVYADAYVSTDYSPMRFL